MTASPASASPGGSPAPSASPGQGSPQGAGQGQGGSPQDGSFDVQTAWKEARAARQEAGKLKEIFSKQSKDLEGLSEDRDTVRKMREVFSPKKETAPDPIEGLTEQLDYYLETAMDLKAKGQSIPLTTNLAVQSFQTMIAQQKAIQALTQQITELKGGLDKANNPEAPVNNMAYAQLESFMTSAIDGLYGNEPGSHAVKGQIYDATVRLIQANLKELQAKAPQEWDRVRRNPQDLQKIVNAAIKQLVPPRAYSILEKEQIQNTPMHEGELWQAWNDLKEMRPKMEPQKYEQLKGQIRRDILEAQQKSRGRRR